MITVFEDSKRMLRINKIYFSNKIHRGNNSHFSYRLKYFTDNSFLNNNIGFKGLKF